jgi:hypothetical protein
MFIKKYVITHYSQPSGHGTQQEHTAVSAGLCHIGEVTLSRRVENALQSPPMSIPIRYSPRGFFETGGLAAVEREAAQDAITGEREHWLLRLEQWPATAPEDDLMLLIRLESEIRRLRRKLRLPPPAPSPTTVEHRRHQTHERVRRYRQRQRAAQ